jgi:hypothetical protein
MSDYDDLAIYNAERHRGLVHTDEYRQRMAMLQQRFDDERRAEDEDGLYAGVLLIDAGHLLLKAPTRLRAWWGQLPRRSA